MSRSVPAEVLLLKLVDYREGIDRLARAVLRGSKGVFDQVSVPIPRVSSSPELAFLRTVSWLYVHYFEVGRVGTAFLRQRLKAYAISSGEAITAHIQIVERLRTYIQHNLRPDRARDAFVQQECEDWFAAACGTRLPDSDDHWLACLQALLGEAVTCLEGLMTTLRCIEGDESVDTIVAAWQLRLRRDIRPERFDPLISVVASDLGRSALDTVGFRQRHYERWVSDLSLLQGDYEFEWEARRLIERELLSDRLRLLPITGKDVIRELGIEPGPHVGVLLGRADELFRQAPCGREELLERVRNDSASMDRKAQDRLIQSRQR